MLAIGVDESEKSIMLKLSVIIASYNNAQFMTKCLESIFNQTLQYGDYEVIIVDDHSSDDSANIIESYVIRYPNIVFIKKTRNEGLFLSRFDGMNAAKGKFILFLDSDDWAEPDMLDNEFQIAIEKKADIIEFGYYYETINRCEIRHQLDTKFYDVTEIIKMFSDRRINTFLWLKLYSSTIIQSVISYITDNYEREYFIGVNTDDEFLFPLLLNKCDSYYVSESCYYHYRGNVQGSITNKLEKDISSKIRHAHILISACKCILKSTKSDYDKYPYYIYLQINNMFYLLGLAERNKSLDVWNEVKTVYCDFIKNFYFPYNRYKKYNFYIITRKIHLFIKILMVRTCLMIRK